MQVALHFKLLILADAVLIHMVTERLSSILLNQTESHIDEVKEISQLIEQQARHLNELVKKGAQ